MDRLDMKNMRKEHKEKEPQVITAARIGCMDEDDRVGPDIVKIGVAGSGVVEKRGGNESLYSIHNRENMELVTPYIFDWVRSFAKKLGVGTYVSDHLECGAGGAQGLTAEKLNKLTSELAVKNGVIHTGQLPMSHAPAKTSKGDLLSWFDRDPGQPHSAGRITISIGGGVSGEEKEYFEKKSGISSFDISADWCKYALDSRLSQAPVVQNLVFQFRLAYAIAENVRNSSDPFNVFDAKRIDPSESNINAGVVMEAVAIAKKEISHGLWKAASHH